MANTATNFQATVGLQLAQLQLTGPLPASPTVSVNKGTSPFTIGDLAFTFGSGTSLVNGAIPVNQAYITTQDIAGSANLDLDLTNLVSPFGDAINFSKIKYVMVEISAPDGTKHLLIGPQNVTNGFTGPWGGGGATVYEDVYWPWKLGPSPAAGWTVDGTHKVFRINNPTGSTITARIVILGVH